MNKQEIKYKLFDIDKAINKIRKEEQEEKTRRRLPRVYKMKPEDIKGDTVDSQSEPIKNKIKKEFKKHKL